MGKGTEAMWTLADKVVKLMLDRSKKVDIRGLRTKFGVEGTRFMIVEIFDDAHNAVDGKIIGKYLWALRGDKVEQWDYEQSMKNALVKPSIRAQIGAYAAINFMRLNAAPIALRNQRRIRWEYLDKNPLNNYHRDMMLFAEILKEIQRQLKR